MIPMNADTEDNGVYGYMCKTDFECELGAACGGNRIFPSVQNLKECKPCVESCGIVKVIVHYVETIQEENFDDWE